MKNSNNIRYYINYFCLSIYGTLNNLGYVVVNSSADDLSRKFNNQNLIGLIPGANVFFGFLVRGINTFLLEKVNYNYRVIANAIICFLGYLIILLSLVAFNNGANGTLSFFIALLGISCVGSSSSFGESVILGYLKSYQPPILNGFSLGTGLAGVCGSGLYLLLVAIGSTLFETYTILIPLVLIYYLSFFFLKKPTKEELDQYYKEQELKLEKKFDKEVLPINESEPIIEASDSVIYIPLDETKSQRYLRILKLVLWTGCNLSLVYLFEYVVSVGLASVAEPPIASSVESSDISYVQKNSYAILSFCYQLGVLISRSSLPVIKIHRIEILTILQFFNFLLWYSQAVWFWINIYVQFVLMFYVGLLGGASYVNCFYRILNMKNISVQDKDLAVNFTAIFITVGITASSLADLVIDNLIFTVS
eukprot:TRINITY_DN3337_c0_g3_i1.p1 TRINITY_DN3337_c0_g3~~TRINITY_DN3337_c0_g3_i1.p1  ORF type:complete len:421 (-),score=68.55 TRINITY_DN3337_c0_g3_i1:186-1448(-)